MMLDFSSRIPVGHCRTIPPVFAEPFLGPARSLARLRGSALIPAATAQRAVRAPLGIWAGPRKTIKKRIDNFSIKQKNNCAGCGIRIQVDNPKAVGYLDNETFQLSKKSLKILCKRCSDLRSGAMVPGVEDYMQKLERLRMEAAAQGQPDALANKQLLTSIDIEKRLMFLKHRYAFIIMLVDLSDVSGTILAGVRKLCAGNPIMMVATKADLLPANTPVGAIKRWLKEYANFRGIKVLGVNLVSSHTLEGVQRVVDYMMEHQQGRDIFILGAANVGKSAFIRAILECLNREELIFLRDPFGGLANKTILPTESPMPGTTLDIIPIAGFPTGGVLFDTPGVHIHHRATHMLLPSELKMIHPVAPLEGVVRVPAKEEVEGVVVDGMVAGRNVRRVQITYQIGAVGRIDVLEAPTSLQLSFHLPPALVVTALPLQEKEGSTFYPQELEGVDPETQLGRMAAEACGLVVKLEKEVPVQEAFMRLNDLAWSGIPGWVTLSTGPGVGAVKLRVWALKTGEAFLRPPIPIWRRRQSPSGSVDVNNDNGADWQPRPYEDFEDFGVRRRIPQPASLDDVDLGLSSRRPQGLHKDRKPHGDTSDDLAGRRGEKEQENSGIDEEDDWLQNVGRVIHKGRKTSTEPVRALNTSGGSSPSGRRPLSSAPLSRQEGSVIDKVGDTSPSASTSYTGRSRGHVSVKPGDDRGGIADNEDDSNRVSPPRGRWRPGAVAKTAESAPESRDSVSENTGEVESLVPPALNREGARGDAKHRGAAGAVSRPGPRSSSRDRSTRDDTLDWDW